MLPIIHHTSQIHLFYKNWNGRRHWKFQNQTLSLAYPCYAMVLVERLHSFGPEKDELATGSAGWAVKFSGTSNNWGP